MLVMVLVATFRKLGKVRQNKKKNASLIKVLNDPSNKALCVLYYNFR